MTNGATTPTVLNNPMTVDWTRLIVQVGGWVVVGYAFLNELPKIRQVNESVAAAIVANATATNNNTAAIEGLKHTNAELIRELRLGGHKPPNN